MGFDFGWDRRGKPAPRSPTQRMPSVNQMFFEFETITDCP